MDAQKNDERIATLSHPGHGCSGAGDQVYTLGKGGTIGREALRAYHEMMPLPGADLSVTLAASVLLKGHQSIFPAFLPIPALMHKEQKKVGRRADRSWKIQALVGDIIN